MRIWNNPIRFQYKKNKDRVDNIDKEKIMENKHAELEKSAQLYLAEISIL